MDWTVLVPVLVVIAGLGNWLITSRIEHLRKATEKLQDQKKVIYSEIMEPFAMLTSTDPEIQNNAGEVIKSVDYRKKYFEFCFIGDDKAVKAFNSMMQYFYKRDKNSSSDKVSTQEYLRLWGNVLLEIRKGVKSSNTKLTYLDMLRGTIKDVDSYMK